MTRTQDTLPSYLSKYCIEHDVSKYTSRDHAAWRYIMRRAIPFFREHAVNGYEKGLAETGISTNRIPHIDDMDKALQKIGWGAVPVCGFIPPWAFLEFQARKILPIATDMRSVNHIAYTPAPDIVHEAAGHAPILPDVDYNNYLSYYAKLGTKAVYSKQDLQLYEAVRYLSDIKEKPESTIEAVSDAERRLSAAIRSFSYASEATKVGRMSWWTAEYGLVGSLEKPKIFGAGLLSSVGESLNAMTPGVKKIPLSIDCTNFSFNITEPQPQLFVAEDMKHLHSVLHELDDTLAYRKSGLQSLTIGLAAEAVTTTTLDSGIQISGKIANFESSHGQCTFLKYEGPVQLCYEGRELTNQGISRHTQGYSTPLGRLVQFPDIAFHQLDARQLSEAGIEINHKVTLSFSSGFTLKGQVTQILRQQGKLLLLSFADCTVIKGEKIYFEPAWGEFDLALGESVLSVCGGPCQRETYGEHEIIETETTPGRSTPYTEGELQLFDQYQLIRELRQVDNHSVAQQKLEQAATVALQHTPHEWLLLLEMYELAKNKLALHPENYKFVKDLESHLHNVENSKDENAEHLSHGLSLIH